MVTFIKKMTRIEILIKTATWYPQHWRRRGTYCHRSGGWSWFWGGQSVFVGNLSLELSFFVDNPEVSFFLVRLFLSLELQKKQLLQVQKVVFFLSSKNGLTFHCELSSNYHQYEVICCNIPSSWKTEPQRDAETRQCQDHGLMTSCELMISLGLLSYFS